MQCSVIRMSVQYLNFADLKTCQACEILACPWPPCSPCHVASGHKAFCAIQHALPTYTQFPATFHHHAGFAIQPAAVLPGSPGGFPGPRDPGYTSTGAILHALPAYTRLHGLGSPPAISRLGRAPSAGRPAALLPKWPGGRRHVDLCHTTCPANLQSPKDLHCHPLAPGDSRSTLEAAAEETGQDSDAGSFARPGPTPPLGPCKELAAWVQSPPPGDDFPGGTFSHVLPRGGRSLGDIPKLSTWEEALARKLSASLYFDSLAPILAIL